jgi:hypothetical protein
VLLFDTMTDEEHKIDTAYALVIASSQLPSQAYHVILYQWLAVLQARGVPKCGIVRA